MDLVGRVMGVDIPATTLSSAAAATATFSAAYLAEDNSSELLGAIIPLLALTIIAVGLRLYTRLLITHAFAVEDALMLAGLANFIISCALLIHGIPYGIGRHNVAVTDDGRKVIALRDQALAAATYITDMMFVKASVGVFLLRLATRRVYVWTLRVSIAAIVAWSLALFFWDVFQCNPVAAQWDLRLPQGRCFSAQQVVNAGYALSVMTILTDWMYALLPIPMVWGLDMTKQAKLTVLLLLGMGVFASVATLIRLKFLATLTDVDDILFASTNAMVWTVVEPGVAIIASSLVTIRPLLRAMRIRGFTGSETTTPSSRGGRAVNRLRYYVSRSKSNRGKMHQPINDNDNDHNDDKRDKSSIPLGLRYASGDRRGSVNSSRNRSKNRQSAQRRRLVYRDGEVTLLDLEAAANSGMDGGGMDSGGMDSGGEDTDHIEDRAVGGSHPGVRRGAPGPGGSGVEAGMGRRGFSGGGGKMNPLPEIMELEPVHYDMGPRHGRGR